MFPPEEAVEAAEMAREAAEDPPPPRFFLGALDDKPVGGEDFGDVTLALDDD